MAYVRISLEEMQQVLKADKGWTFSVYYGEFVFQYALKSFPGARIKVYSSIRSRDGQGRRRGGDSIKIAAVHVPTGKGLVKSARVYREPGWQDRVKERIIEAIQLAKQRTWMVQ